MLAAETATGQMRFWGLVKDPNKTGDDNIRNVSATPSASATIMVLRETDCAETIPDEVLNIIDQYCSPEDVRARLFINKCQPNTT